MGAKAGFFFFSEYACVTFWNNTSFSFIHQAENIPSHLFHKISRSPKNVCNGGGVSKTRGRGRGRGLFSFNKD